MKEGQTSCVLTRQATEVKITVMPPEVEISFDHSQLSMCEDAEWIAKSVREAVHLAVSTDARLANFRMNSRARYHV